MKPNFVIFIADDLGIGDIGCFGNDTIHTPAIDSIAKEGAKLTHNLVAAPTCSPSRAALLTGRYPIRSGMASALAQGVLSMITTTDCKAGLPRNETTFAELVKAAGYATAIIGGKGQNWEGGIRVPTVVRYPPMIPRGIEISVPTSTMDVFPTIASLAGVDLPSDRVIDGRDLMPLLRGTMKAPPHDYLFHYCGQWLNAVTFTSQKGTCF
ncbi:steryl-sulfatase-like [Ptychodera flava]|uniref:steryl-sulfatase-like n=1 Tax=Ptychodera flava TaxID=63121 RepID=UPI00396A6C5D